MSYDRKQAQKRRAKKLERIAFKEYKETGNWDEFKDKILYVDQIWSTFDRLIY